MCFSGILPGENVNTLSGRCFDDKMDGCLCFYPQTIQHKMVMFPHVWKETKYMEMAWP